MNNSTKIALGVSLIAIGITIAFRRKSSNGTATLINNSNSNSQYNMSTNTALPRGYRNNNPLNLEISKEQWKGKLSPNTDGRFEQFVSLPYGYRANLINMRTSITKHGCDTIGKLINRWAPPGENNVASYINRVCNYMGELGASVNANTKLSANDKEMLCKMAYAMSRVENEAPQYMAAIRNAGLPNMEIIYKGWELI